MKKIPKENFPKNDKNHDEIHRGFSFDRIVSFISF